MTPIASPRCAVTLGQLLATQAELRSDQVALRFIEPGHASLAASAVTELTFAQLHRRAALVAAHLARIADPGERVLLLCPPGADYVAALFGCFYAGLIAVPAYPPMAAGVDERLRLLLQESAPRAILTTDLRSPLCTDAGIEDLARSAGVTMMVVDTLIVETPEAHDARFEPRGSKPGDVALLQYTSESTGNPRGVM